MTPGTRAGYIPSGRGVTGGSENVTRGVRRLAGHLPARVGGHPPHEPRHGARRHVTPVVDRFAVSHRGEAFVLLNRVAVGAIPFSAQPLLVVMPLSLPIDSSLFARDDVGHLDLAIVPDGPEPE